MLLYLSQLLPLLGVLFTISCGAEEYYVTPTPPPNPGCSQFAPGKPCYTLDQYAKNANYINGKSNISLIFLDGVHNSSEELLFYYEGARNLVLRPFDHVNPQVTIRNFVMTYISHGRDLFSMQYLNIDGGSLTVSGQIDFQMLIASTVMHRCTLKTQQQATNDCEEITLRDVSMYDSEIVLNSVLDAQQCTMQLLQSVLTNCSLIAYTNRMTIKDTVLYTDPNYTSLFVQQTKSHNGELILDNTTIVDLQTIPDGHGVPSSNRDPLTCFPIEGYPLCDVCIRAGNFAGTINITNSNLTRNFGTAVCIFLGGNDTTDVYITGTTISDHKQGALTFFNFAIQPEFANILRMTIENSTIHNNSFSQARSNVASAGITVYKGNADVQIAIRNTVFSNNCNLVGQPSAILMFQIDKLEIVDCEFHGNSGTALAAYYSEFTLAGEVSFTDNTANQGGALSLISSHMNITRNTSIVFQNNSATDVGGAIYIEQQSARLYLENQPELRTGCFYTLVNLSNDSSINVYSLHFINNTAKHGGEQIYGVSLNSFCIPFDVNDISKANFEIKDIFHFEPGQTTSSSAISSEPTRVCICDTSGQYNCKNIAEIFLNTTAIPGEEFNLSVVVVGSEFGTGTGSVYAQFLPLHSPNNARFSSENQYSQGIRDYKNCTTIKYSIYSAYSEEVIVLTAYDSIVEVYGSPKNMEQYIQDFSNGPIPAGLLTTPVYVNVTLLPCPPGFTLTGDPPGCVCYPVFEKNAITCSITNGVGYVHRNGTLWVNASYIDNTTTNVIVHKYCPFGYCRPQLVSVDLNNPDIQCDFDRSGTLCGACRKGYSAALGTSKCLKCTNNNHLALLLFFALSGILLVLFIKVLNLTVTQGTINGLIFYANIVWANQSILYPHETSGASVFFKTFIAWLNLDFGIETCFIEGLDAYWKTWLQFVFPFYIWIIAGGIILASRYSTLMTRFFGNNSVHVLATLLLLSYSKLLRTIINALNVTFLVEYPSGQRSAVWSFDGNVPYCGIPHIFLFLAALAALLFLWLPYTSVLLFVQLLKRFSEFKILRWIDKMKPILDAYFAPLKDKHHYWVGVLLLVRGVLLVIFSLTSANKPTANLLLLSLLASALLAYTSITGHLYKKNYVSLLETLSFLNLILISGGVLYIEQAGGNKAALVFTSVGIAFIQFVATVLFHLWGLVKCQNKNHREIKLERFKKTDGTGRGNAEEKQTVKNSEDFSKLRESLLAEDY